jgi:hypothetical protein
MRWIRSPLWDSLWFLSGPIIGVVLISWPDSLTELVPVFLIFNSGHLISPVAMAWSHPDFRRVMSLYKIRFIIIPLIIIVLGFTAGLLVKTPFPTNPITLAVKVDINNWLAYTNPLIMVLVVYFTWNAYHYCKQNYGMFFLYLPEINKITAMQWATFITLFGFIIIPEMFHQPKISLFFFGLIIFNHQLVSIGIASHIWSNTHHRNPLWFAGAMIIAGGGLTWLILHFAPMIIMPIVGMRATAGFVHFLYERWVYKFSDPNVRETIGRQLFASPHWEKSKVVIPSQGQRDPRLVWRRTFHLSPNDCENINIHLKKT